MACAVLTGTGDFSTMIFEVQPWQEVAMSRAAASQNPNVAALPAPTPWSLMGVLTLGRAGERCAVGAALVLRALRTPARNAYEQGRTMGMQGPRLDPRDNGTLHPGFSRQKPIRGSCNKQFCGQGYGPFVLPHTLNPDTRALAVQFGAPTTSSLLLPQTPLECATGTHNMRPSAHQHVRPPFPRPRFAALRLTPATADPTPALPHENDVGFRQVLAGIRAEE